MESPVRETLIELTDELALHTRTQTAVADRHRITKVWISPKLKRAMHCYETFTRVEVDTNPILLGFQKWYDPDHRRLNDDQPCGTYCGHAVFIDHQLGDYSLRLESVPIKID